MRRTLLLCVQAALVASGSCLQCDTCHAFSDTASDCYGYKVRCSPMEACLVLHLSVQDPENYLSIRVIERQCWNSRDCFKRGVISAGTKRIQFSTQCCSQDNCKMPPPDFSPENNTHNGLVCPFCYSNSNTCVPKTAMKCTGEEKYCFQFTGEIDKCPKCQSTPCHGTYKSVVQLSVKSSNSGSSGKLFSEITLEAGQKRQECLWRRQKSACRGSHPDEIVAKNTLPLVFSGCSTSTYCSLYRLIGEKFRNKYWGLQLVNIICTTATKTSPLPVVNFLLCPTCHGLVGRNCGNVAICSPEHDACLTVILSMNHGSKYYTQQIMRCGLSSECGSAGTITTGHKNISKNTTCCYSTNCKSPIPTLPSENHETNGIQCESCYYKTYGFCTGRDYIACTGNATRCINYVTEQKDGHGECAVWEEPSGDYSCGGMSIKAGELFTSREVFRGCAHPELCRSGNRTVVEEFSSLKETVICGVSSKVSERCPNKLYIYFLLMIYALYTQLWTL